MRHYLKHLVCVAIMAAAALSATAQQTQQLPVDKAVRTGKLKNGLTYYIRANRHPEQRAEFFIAQKVGSILEEPHQYGLAHFLEHMCFNGTKHFPGNERGKGVVQWCEEKGIKFGADLNAYTAVDETVYNISNVPTTNENIVDSCLLILHDWSNSVELRDEEIDKERGVIHEEYRSRMNGQSRLMRDAMRELHKGNKYAECMPIGTLEVIDNFPYQAIKDYYKKWYRPDLQAIIVVGDFDADSMVAKVKRMFADIPAPVNPAERIYYPVPDNDEPLVFIGKDKEITTPTFQIFFKRDNMPQELNNTPNYYVNSFVTSMACIMLNARLAEVSQSANAPFSAAQVNDGDYYVAQTKSAFTFVLNNKTGYMGDAVTAGLAEVERARRYGFTASEYERAKAILLANFESMYNERGNHANIEYAQEYARSFTRNEPIPGIELEYALMQKICREMPLSVINETLRNILITKNNRALYLAMPDFKGLVLPSAEELIEVMNSIENMPLEPYADNSVNEPLMPALPTPGKILSEKKNGAFGTTVMKLSNGATVHVMPTTHKADEILMTAMSEGGTSQYDDSEKLNFAMLNNLIGLGGVGQFNKVELSRQLAGKSASVSVGVSNTHESIDARCAPRDLETMMQLVHLNFTAPRKDGEAFNAFKARLKAQLENKEANPMSCFNDSVRKTLYNNHPRNLYLEADMVDNIDYDRILQMQKERFSDAADFDFFFVGNINIDTLRPLIERYIASLPALNRKEKLRDNKVYAVKGYVENSFARKQEVPTATNLIIYTGKCAYSMKNKILMSYLTQVLNMVYTEEIREKEGGSYGVSVSGNINRWPRQEMMLQISYQTAPEKKDRMNGIVFRELEKIANEGADATMVAKAKEYMLKSSHSAQHENSYWLSMLTEKRSTGIDLATDYDKLVSTTTAAEIKKFAGRLLKQHNRTVITLTAPTE